jgi:hypothetical protein
MHQLGVKQRVRRTHHTTASAIPATPPAMRWVLSGIFSLVPLFQVAGGPMRSPVRPPPNGLDVDVDIVPRGWKDYSQKLVGSDGADESCQVRQGGTGERRC